MQGAGSSSRSSWSVSRVGDTWNDENENEDEDEEENEYDMSTRSVVLTPVLLLVLVLVRQPALSCPSTNSIRTPAVLRG